jgi:tetratricopeptide (TPR) repeat protein
VSRILIIALLIIASAALARAEPLDLEQLAFDRSGFGASMLPIWSDLNEFEERASTQLPAARSGDADALLALYLLASGERLDTADFLRYRNQMNAWLEELPLSRDPGLEARDARRLFVGMHSEYFGTEYSSTGMPDNYLEEQSQIARIFETGEFNCISSALLYIVAARKLDLDVDGVVLPSHAFVQVKLPGEIIEIETTSFNGFGITHDEAFYSLDANEWFGQRNLEPPSYEDYLAREILSPYELGFFNMINQHTAEDRMAYHDRLRLAELRGHFLPQDESAQKSRLAYYYQEFAYLREQGDYGTARRMYERISPWLTGLESSGPNDWEIPVLLTAVQAQMADTLARTGEAEEALTLARRLLQTRDFPEEVRSVESHLFSVVSGYAVELAEREDYPGARLAFDALEYQCLQNKVCNSGLAQVYSAWALHFVDSKNWERSADVYREYLLLDSSSKLSEHFVTNLERVYLNWAASEEWHGEWETAMAVLNQCTQLLTTAPQCEVALQQLDDRYEAGFM